MTCIICYKKTENWLSSSLDFWNSQDVDYTRPSWPGVNANGIRSNKQSNLQTNKSHTNLQTRTSHNTLRGKYNNTHMLLKVNIGSNTLFRFTHQANSWQSEFVLDKKYYSKTFQNLIFLSSIYENPILLFRFFISYKLYFYP